VAIKVLQYMKIRARATAGQYAMAKNRLPATVQGGLRAALALDGAGSNDRGI
jgi:hypothetical protein